MAAVLACGPGAVLSHRSAGQLWGIVPRTSDRAGSDAARRFASPRAGIVAHRVALPADEVEEVDGIPVTSVSRTLFDLAAVLSKRRLERALNEVEVRRLTDRLSLPDLLERYPRRRGAAGAAGAAADRRRRVGITRNELRGGVRRRSSTPTACRGRGSTRPGVRGRFFEADCLWQRAAADRRARRPRRPRHRARLRERPRARPDPRSPRAGARPASPGASCGTNRTAIAADLRRAAARVRGRSASYPVAWTGSSSSTTCATRAGAGPPADGAFTGAAGGAACGDLSRISLTVEDGRIAAVTFDAEGCGATRPRPPRWPRWSTARRCSRRRAIGIDDGRRGDRRPDAGQAPRRRSSPPTPCTAPWPAPPPPDRSASPSHRLRGRPRARRGRHVRRRRQRRRRAARARARGGGGRRHGQALGRPGDRRRQGLLLAGGGARRPRARPLARHPALHPRPRGGVPPPRRRPLPRRLRRRAAPPTPASLCNGEVRIAAMVDLAERLGADAPASPATTPASSRTATGRCSPPPPTRPRTRATCSRRCRRSCSAGSRFPLTELTKPEVREIAARHGLAVAQQAREPGPLLPRRPGQGAASCAATAASRDREGAVLDRSGRADRPPPRPPQLHRRPAPRDRRLRPGAALRARHRRRRQHGHGRHPRPSWRPAASASATRSCTATARASTRSACATTRAPCRPPIGGRRPGRHDALEVELGEEFVGASPGQTAVLLDGETIVGHGTIAAAA